MTDKKMYRHRVTGLLEELDPFVALGAGDVLEEVPSDAKPKTSINELVKGRVTARAGAGTSTKAKEKKDG